MDDEHNKKETIKEKVAAEVDSASATAKTLMERGSEVYGQAEQAVSDVLIKHLRR